MKKTYIRAGQDFSKVFTPQQSIELGSLGSNLGNMLFQNSVWKLLEAIGETPVAIGHDLHEQQSKKINNDGKMLVLPLANSFRLEFKEALDSYTKLIKKLKIPVVVVGVGCQTDTSFNTDNLKPIEKTVKDFVSAVLDRSASIGVRGECTYNYLKSLGFSQVDIVGCPSMYSYGSYFPDIKPLSNISKDTNIAVNISSINNQCEFSRGLEWVGKIFENVCGECGSTTYIPQEQRSLESIIYGSRRKGVEHGLISSHVFDFLVGGNKVITFTDPGSWVNYLKGMDFCFGSRIHGNIAGMLAGIPSVMVVHDSRTLELSQYHEIPYVVANKELENKSLSDIFLAKNFYSTKKIHKKNFERYCAFLRKNGIDVEESGLEKIEPFNKETTSMPLVWGNKYNENNFQHELFMKIKRYKVRQLRKYGYFNF